MNRVDGSHKKYAVSECPDSCGRDLRQTSKLPDKVVRRKSSNNSTQTNNSSVYVIGKYSQNAPVLY